MYNINWNKYIIYIMLFLFVVYVGYAEYRNSVQMRIIRDLFLHTNTTLETQIKNLEETITASKDTLFIFNEEIKQLETQIVERERYYLMITDKDTLLMELDSLRTLLGWHPELLR